MQKRLFALGLLALAQTASAVDKRVIPAFTCAQRIAALGNLERTLARERFEQAAPGRSLDGWIGGPVSHSPPRWVVHSVYGMLLLKRLAREGDQWRLEAYLLDDAFLNYDDVETSQVKDNAGVKLFRTTELPRMAYLDTPSAFRLMHERVEQRLAPIEILALYCGLQGLAQYASSKETLDRTRAYPRVAALYQSLRERLEPGALDEDLFVQIYKWMDVLHAETGGFNQDPEILQSPEMRSLRTYLEFHLKETGENLIRTSLLKVQLAKIRALWGDGWRWSVWIAKHQLEMKSFMRRPKTGNATESFYVPLDVFYTATRSVWEAADTLLTTQTEIALRRWTQVGAAIDRLKGTPSRTAVKELIDSQAAAKLVALKQSLRKLGDGPVYIVPIPSTQNNAVADSTLYIAEEVQRQLEMGVIKSTLLTFKKIPATASTRQLPLVERLIHVAEREGRVKETLTGATIILVDDVLSSRATTALATSSFIGAGAERVVTVALAATGQNSTADLEFDVSTPKVAPSFAWESLRTPEDYLSYLDKYRMHPEDEPEMLALGNPVLVRALIDLRRQTNARLAASPYHYLKQINREAVFAVFRGYVGFQKLMVRLGQEVAETKARSMDELPPGVRGAFECLIYLSWERRYGSMDAWLSLEWQKWYAASPWLVAELTALHHKIQKEDAEGP